MKKKNARKKNKYITTQGQIKKSTKD